MTRNLARLAGVVGAEHVDQIINGADLLDARMHRLPPTRRAAEFVGGVAHVLGPVVGNADALAALVGRDEELAGEAAQRLVGKVDVPGAAPGPTAVLITGAIGRAERTAKTIASTDLSRRLQPEKVLPEQISQAVPGVIWMLLAVNGGSM